ncbi:MAG: ribosome recycling factor, partial [Acetobacter sp.]|nr:ribosome recycling factor [Acetobacter sp.]
MGRAIVSNLNELLDDLKHRMEGALSNLRREFSGLRSGRASPALLETVRVEA